MIIFEITYKENHGFLLIWDPISGYCEVRSNLLTAFSMVMMQIS